MITPRQIREKAQDMRKMSTVSFEAHWLDEIADALEEYDTLFDLRHGADMRAIHNWQAAHPGNELVWPDHADMVVWLLDELLDAHRKRDMLAERAAEYERKCDEALARLNPILGQIETQNK